MDEQKLARPLGRPPKYPAWLRLEVVRAVANSPEMTIEAICRAKDVNPKTGWVWVRDARKELGSRITSPAPQGDHASACESMASEINHAEEGHVSIQAHSTSATTPKDTEEENGSKTS
jgi:transposase-like protein